MEIFPTSKQCTVIIVALTANGESSYRDAKHISELTSKKWNGTQHIISDRKMVPGCILVSNKLELLKEITYLVSRSMDADILFCISAHGYSNSKDQYLRVGSDIVLDHELRFAFYETMNPNILSLCLIDTCHSGSMMDLPYCSRNGTTFEKDILSFPGTIPSNSYCISACSDSELAGEDISDSYGWGGKLICKFLDYLNAHDSINIFEFYQHVLAVFSRQSEQRSHPILSRSDFQDMPK